MTAKYTLDYALGWNAAIAKVIDMLASPSTVESLTHDADIPDAEYVVDEVADRVDDLYVPVPSGGCLEGEVEGDTASVTLDGHIPQ